MHLYQKYFLKNKKNIILNKKQFKKYHIFKHVVLSGSSTYPLAPPLVPKSHITNCSHYENYQEVAGRG
jgi:hypothetical protein